MKPKKFTLAVLTLVASNLALAQVATSSLYGPPDARQYLPYGVATPQMSGTFANGTTFDYRNDRKRVAHFWKTYAHRLVPIVRGTDSQFGGSTVSTFWNIPTNWTGDVLSCQAGTVSLGIQEAAVRQVNWYRAMAGVGSLTNGPDADRVMAQQAALVNRSGFDKQLGLTHNPTAAYPCFSPEAAIAASQSELDGFFGINGRGPVSVDNFFDDAGPNNYYVGHRQGLLYPDILTVGYGEATTPDPANPTVFQMVYAVSAMPLGIIMPRAAVADVLWPNAGFIPVQTYPMISNRWSMGCVGCDFSTATVLVFRNGAIIANTITSQINHSIPTLVWEIQGLNYRQHLEYSFTTFTQDDVFDTTVTYKKNGQPATKTYRTTVFNPEVDVDYAPPFDLTDQWVVPTEAGWNVNLAQATDGSVSGAIAIYDAAGNPRWLTLRGLWSASGVLTGKLYATTGPAFSTASFNPSLVTGQPVGKGVLTFAADTQALRFDFSLDGQTGSKQMVRNSAAEAYRDGANYRGLWWNMNEGGQGLTIAQYFNTLSVVWCTYAADGSPLWVSLQGNWTSSTTFIGNLVTSKQAPGNLTAYNGSATVYTQAGTGKLTFTAPNRVIFDYTLQGITGQKLLEKREQSFVSSVPMKLLPAAAGGIDIDGQGKSQLLLRSPANNQLQVGRFMNNAFQFSPIADPGPNFRILGVVDIDGDGKSDLVYQDTTQGEYGDVHFWPDFVAANDKFLRKVKLAWQVQAVGDLDGDGFGDMVFRFTGDDGRPDDTGVSYVWFTDGAAVKQVRKRGGAPLTWTLLGAADVNADGAADLVYVSATGQIRVLMATGLRTCANLAAGSLPAGFTALKLADFTGLGKGDILARNAATGEVQLVTLDSVGIPLPAYVGTPDDPNASCTGSALSLNTTTVSVGTVDPTWKFYAAGDFNGRGINDVVWVQPNQTLTMWQMNSGVVAPGLVGSAGAAPSGFAVVQP